MRRVLIVDDNVGLAENIAEVLEMEGHETRVAITAAEGLAKAVAWNQDVVITDYRLPDSNGADLLRQIQKLGLRVRALVISAYTDDSTIDDARSAGADFVPKPIDLRELGELVRA